ncbi:MAG: glycoside hydrolase family 3 N-terminal domain-containing protein [Bacteroidales bacterium]
MPLVTSAQPRTSIRPDSMVWVDSVLQSLSLDEKIGQLLNIRVMSGKDEKYYAEVERLIQTYAIGGLTFFKGSPTYQVQLTQRLQQKARVPLMIAMDAETGPAMRLDSVVALPDMMVIGATGNENFALEAGRMAGDQCKRLGVHLNFAPVADVNTNPANPVIGQRAFGEDPEQIGRFSGKYLEGLHQARVLSCLKHFPGHGDSETDSHYVLPIIKLNADQIYKKHLVPFQQNLQATDAIMTGHLWVPALDSLSGQPASLSPIVVTQLLRKQMGFSGLIITDALDMQGAGKPSYPGEIEVKALKAGNDILLLPRNAEEAIKAIRKAVDSGQITLQEMEEHCRRVLAYKFKAGLWENSSPNSQGLLNDLNRPEYFSLVKNIYRNAITVCGDTSLLPYRPAKFPRLAVISIFQHNLTLQELTWLMADAGYFILSNPEDTIELQRLTDTLQYYDMTLVALHIPSKFQNKNYGLNSKSTAACNLLINTLPNITLIVGPGYAAGNFTFRASQSAQVFLWQNQEQALRAAMEIVFGEVSSSGKLPASVGARFRMGDGLKTQTQNVLRWAEPAEVGIDPHKLVKIDSIAQEGVKKGAYPGCQILLARHGRVFYYKAFGKQDAAGTSPVAITDLYDIASVTKIAATTLAVMRLYEQKVWDDDTQLKEILPQLTNHRLRNARLSDVLRHQAGLYPWIPFYKKTLDEGVPSSRYYSSTFRPGFEIPVAGSLYMRNDYIDTILSIIDHTRVNPSGKFVYSDFGFILLKFGIERVTHQPFAEYLEENFYRPMGLASLRFNPWETIPSRRIAPTSIDTEFRKQLLKGYVHDPAAAMLGGVSGHAGLFSHALDLARIMQMLLWEGNYNGVKFFEAETIRHFTSYGPHPEKNRRGLGFDKPPLYPEPNGPVCPAASPQSFGHSGFTGTYVWADPANGLIYVFLSNRVQPNEENHLINKLNIRTRIHQAAYEAIVE